MDFLNLLIPKEKIVGIEISNRKLRMLALAKDSFGNIVIQGKSEADLEDGAVDFGEVKNKEKLSGAVAELKKNFKPQSALSPFAIVTISQNGVYSDILKFPKNLTDEQLVEAVSFNAAKILPLSLSESYLDWQVIERGENTDKVLVCAIPRAIADSFINVLKENGFKLIALEPVSLSIGRAADISKEPVLFLYLTEEGATSIIYKENNSYLSQFEFWREAARGGSVEDLNGLSDVLTAKIKNLANYFENQYHNSKIKKALIMSEGFDADEIVKKIKIDGLTVEKAKSAIASIKNYDWIPAAGAAKRAFIPRSEDTIISLLPVGTEDLYEKQKAISFFKSILAVVATMASFYAAAFILAFFFISYLDNDIEKQMVSRSNLSMPAEYIKIDQETKEFNAYISDLSGIYFKTNIDYAKVLEKISGLNSFGVSLTGIGFIDFSKPVSVTGIASSRESLNAFKSQMAGSSSFGDVKFSVQNIAQKSNIPFNATFYLK